MSKILVTGAAGFIGSHTCLVLLQSGHEIYALDSFESSSSLSLKIVSEINHSKSNEKSNKLHVLNVDLRNFDDLQNIFEKIYSNGEEFLGVIHFAALKSVSESVNSPIKYWETNLIATINLLKVMDKYNCKTIVFSSSASIYGNSEQSKIKENSDLRPLNPYGNTKVAAEQLLNDLFQSDSNWQIAILRYFNPIGAHSSGLIGEDPLSEAKNIFPLITKVALGQQNKLIIYGNDWPTKDGTGVRDYIHVMDLAEGHLRTLKYLIEHTSKIFNLNIGTGIGTSVLELVEVFQRVNNVYIPYTFRKRREGDSAVTIADNTKLKNLLNWEPKRTIEEMCIDGWRWQKRNPRGYVLDR